MKTKIAIAVAALLLASGTAYAAMQGGSCCNPGCCDEAHQGDHAGHHMAPAQPKQ